MIKLKALFGAAFAGTAMVGSAAFAQTTPVDVSTVTDAVSAAGVAGATIGLAILGMHYGIKLYRWVRQAG